MNDNNGQIAKPYGDDLLGKLDPKEVDVRRHLTPKQVEIREWMISTGDI
jgi:hypothetical protein